MREHAQRAVVARAHRDHVDPDINVAVALGQQALGQTAQLALLARVNRFEQIQPPAGVAAAAHFDDHRRAARIAGNNVRLAPGARVVALEDAVPAGAQPLRGELLGLAPQRLLAAVSRPPPRAR